MRALDRKLIRDLSRLRGQMLTIALVIAAGLAAFISLRGTYRSLELARSTYYERQRFADVFASLERAPASLSAAVEHIPGVSRVETRIVKFAMLPLLDVAEPFRAQVLSLGPEPTQALNRLHLSSGRWLEPGRGDEVMVLESFATARGVRPGDRLPAILNGKKRELRVVGVALSPEYVLATAAGDLAPDPARFAVLWMSQDALAATFQMEGAVNSLALTLQPGASSAAVIDALDRLLEPYGGTGAFARAQQPSDDTIEGELSQLEAMSTLLPLIFLGVAALLVNVVLSRLVFLQRPDIATLKAIGYSDREIGAHFFELVIVIGAAGALGGIALGVYFGRAMVGLYEQYFKFPNLRFSFDAESASLAVLASLAAALAGAFGAVRRVVALPPAEAMRPPAPARYRRSLIERLGLSRFAGPPLHMIVRELERRPLRTALSALAIAASVGLMVVGGWYRDGIDELLHNQFHELMREDASVAFSAARPERALGELAHVPGVLTAEGMRVVPVRFRAGHRSRNGLIWGYPAGGELRQLRDRYARPARLPPDGVVLTDVLARVLGLEVGDEVEVELREGARERRAISVTGLVDEAFGLQGHMTREALARLLDEEPSVNFALLRTDPAQASVIDARLKDMPFVASVTRRANMVKRFEDQSADMVLTLSVVVMAFAATITVGVVYNNARVALSLRSRDLASMRVLGFTRREISSILLGEMAFQVLLALPLGLWFGKLLVLALAATVDPERWRMPIILTSRSYALAALVALLASVASALLVRRRLDRLDLIGVLKTRE
ncbi:MAG: ABC transporter permease [Sorangiineae bacterium]|nr:ABC transporter permease [Polyangiaceae bacterium]MEB2322027.1 ABC transporter permease [Sorangiineae bacterium]